VYPGSSHDIQIVMAEVPDGVSGFNITIFIFMADIFFWRCREIDFLCISV
jgi:hypothetical protein